MSDDGAGLRAQLTETTEKLGTVTDRNQVLEAEAAIRTGGFDRVTAEQLVGVEVEKMADTAKELQEAAVKGERDSVRKALGAKGLADKELDEAVDKLLDPENKDLDGLEAVTRARELGSGGDPVPTLDPSKLSPTQLIEEGLNRSDKARARR